MSQISPGRRDESPFCKMGNLLLTQKLSPAHGCTSRLTQSPSCSACTRQNRTFKGRAALVCCCSFLMSLLFSEMMLCMH